MMVYASARLAQSVEHETLNLRVVGSSPTLGAQKFFSIILSLFLFFSGTFFLMRIKLKTALNSLHTTIVDVAKISNTLECVTLLTIKK